MFDWLGDIFSGIGNAIGSTFEALGEQISNVIWNTMLQWLYETIYNAVADFFTMMGNMGADIFQLDWIQATIRLFTLFGWALFAAGVVVAIFDVAIEYQCGRANIKTTAINILKGFFACSLIGIVRWNCTNSASACRIPSPMICPLFSPVAEALTLPEKAPAYWSAAFP